MFMGFNGVSVLYTNRAPTPLIFAYILKTLNALLKIAALHL